MWLATFSNPLLYGKLGYTPKHDRKTKMIKKKEFVFMLFCLTKCISGCAGPDTVTIWRKASAQVLGWLMFGAQPLLRCYAG